MRVFNRYGNRKNKNLARMKFVMRDRGIEWLKEQIEKEYADILTNGGIAWPDLVPEGFGGYQSKPQPLGNGALLPVCQPHATGDPAYDAWLETNVVEQRQAGYAARDRARRSGEFHGRPVAGIARIAARAGDGLVRVSVDQNLLLSFVPLARLRPLYQALDELGLAASGAGRIEDVTTCPGAYTCNLGLTKSMNFGHALRDEVRRYDDPQVQWLSIKVSGCPNSCGQHWIADFGFYGNVWKIDGKEIPYYQMLLGGGYDEQGICGSGLAVQSIPVRLRRRL